MAITYSYVTKTFVYVTKTYSYRIMPTLRHFYDGFIEFFYKLVKVIVVHRLGVTFGATFGATFLPTLHPAEALCLWALCGYRVQRVARFCVVSIAGLEVLKTCGCTGKVSAVC